MKKLVRLFFEMSKIALFVVGGGYAILAVADDVFGRKLKWLREGELLEHLPIFQMVPGLIAGNTAIYTGLKVAGRLGAVIALVAVALPSLIVFLAVSCGYAFLPAGNNLLDGTFLGLRSAMTGIILATFLRGWKKTISDTFGLIVFMVATILIVALHVNTAMVLATAMSAGIVRTFISRSASVPALADGIGISLQPLPSKKRIALILSVACVIALLSWSHGAAFWTFVKFGLLSFGGGYVLVPLYLETFVGPAAPMLQIPQVDFSNIMALSQTTPGPISVNAATFFGFRLGGVAGAIVATAGLLLPSLMLLTAVLTGLEKWKKSLVVQGILRGVMPATCALLVSALLAFAGMSVWSRNGSADIAFHPLAIVMASLAATAFFSRRLSAMAVIFICAAIGCCASLLMGTK